MEIKHIEAVGIQWAWRTHLLAIELKRCGHRFEDRPPRPSMSLGMALAVIRRYRDLTLGLADASLVVLAQRFRTRRLLTFDERAFRAVAPLQGGTFTVLPADR